MIKRKTQAIVQFNAKLQVIDYKESTEKRRIKRDDDIGDPFLEGMGLSARVNRT